MGRGGRGWFGEGEARQLAGELRPLENICGGRDGWDRDGRGCVLSRLGRGGCPPAGPASWGPLRPSAGGGWAG